MSCNWCQDEGVAYALIGALCGKDSEAWKQESNSDLCFCTPCVREYHRWKNVYITEKPECEQILYKIEEERLQNHFRETLNQKEHQPGSILLSQFPYDVEDYLKVPILEVLQYPYLLFNKELMNLFVDVLVLLINNGRFYHFDEKLPGIYLLLVNPSLKVRQWALKTARDLGKISLEDYLSLLPIINCILKIVLYDLDTQHIEESVTGPVPLTAIGENTNPVPHLYHPLLKKDLWLALGVIFNAMEEDVLRMLFSVRGHCQVLAIIKNTLENKDPDSEAAFWALLFCLKVLMEKLESTFWLLTNFDDAPKTTFRLILSHSLHEKELKTLANKPLEMKQDVSEDEVTLSQVAEKDIEDLEEAKRTEKHLVQPFFWMLPYIVTVLDLEDLCENITCDVIMHLVTLLSSSTTFWSGFLPTELDYFVLKCLCDILKYLIERKLTFLIKTLPSTWISIMFHLRFGNFNMNGIRPAKRWNLLVMKAHAVLLTMIDQAADVSLDDTISGLCTWLRTLKPGRSVDDKMVKMLKDSMPKVLQKISKTDQLGLSISDLHNKRLFSLSSEDEFHEISPKLDVEKVPTGSSISPIYIIDSDEEDDSCKSLSKDEKEASLFEPVLCAEDLDYTEDTEMKMDGPENDAKKNREEKHLAAVEKMPVEMNSKKTVSAKSPSKVDDSKSKERKSCVPNNDDKTDEGRLITCNIHEVLQISDSDNENFLMKGRPPVKYQYIKKGLNEYAKSGPMTGGRGLSDNGHLSSKENDFENGSQAVEKPLGLKKEERVLETKISDQFVYEKHNDIEIEKQKRTVREKPIDEEDGKASEIANGLNKEIKGLEEDSKKIEMKKGQEVSGYGKEIDVKHFYHSSKSVDSCFESKVKMKPLKRKSLEIDHKDNFVDADSFKEVKPTGMEYADIEVEGTRTKDKNETKLEEEVTNEKGKGEVESGGKKLRTLSPVEKRGLFDFIGEIKKGNEGEFCFEEEDDKAIEKKSSEGKNYEISEKNCLISEGDDRIENTVIKGNNLLSNEAYKSEEKTSNEAFQKKKTILYDMFVKKQKLRESVNEKEHEGTNDVCESAENEPHSDKISKIDENVKDNEKAPSQLHGSLPEVRKHKLYTRDSLLKYILSWHPVWMTNEQQDELSITLPYEPQSVKIKYNSYDEYMSTMWPLVLVEFFAQIIKDHKDGDKQQFDFKFKCFDPVIESQSFRIIHCESLQDYVATDMQGPCENDLVILRCVDEHIIEVFGVIEEVERTFLNDGEDPQGPFSFTLINLKIKVANLHPGFKISSLQIEIVASMVSLYRRWDALMRMPKSLLAGDILSPFRPQVFELTNREESGDISSKLKREYNQGQCNAITKITQAVVQAFPLPKLRLLQGPPGTGKTRTLKGLVKNILQSLPKGENSRILICAASNAAVDEIVLRLKQDPPRLSNNNNNNTNNISTNRDHKPNLGSRQQSKRQLTNCGDFNLLRIGTKSQVNPKVMKLSLEYLVNAELEKIKMHSNPNTLKSEIHKIAINLKQLDKKCTKLKMSGDKTKHSEWKKKMAEREHEQRRYEDLQKRLAATRSKRDLKTEEKRLRASFLTKADIICCTLSGSGSKQMVNTFRNEWNIRNGTPFACVIIDEAGQCCEPEALIPLQYGSSKLVLIGDPAQLPATVFSKRALRYGYGQSMFERIQSAFHEHAESPVLTLEEQYRMHPAICAFPSQKFYGGRLKTAKEILQHRVLPGIRPIVVLNIGASKELKSSTGVYHNPEERSYVMSLCEEIVASGISTAEMIGVITPYRKQMKELRAELNDRQLDKVEVNTIDGFQGREKDIIILSCVRAQNMQSGIGFLDDIQRMNVALTRARHSLILLVHAASLQVDEDWKDLMQFARNEKFLFDIETIDDAKQAVFVKTEKTLNATKMWRSSAAERKSEMEAGSKEESNALQCDKQSSVANEGAILNENKTRQIAGEQSNNELHQSKRKESRNRTDAVKNGEGTGSEVCGLKMKNVAAKEKSHDQNMRSKSGKASKVKTSNFPQEHKDGTKCVDKSLENRQKHTVPPGRFPHKHRDGTKCIDQCLKTGERSMPSSAYFILPHDHADGTKCIDRCVRLEERERQRREKEKALGKAPINGMKDLKFNYIRGEEGIGKESLEKSNHDVEIGQVKISGHLDLKEAYKTRSSPHVFERRDMPNSRGKEVPLQESNQFSHQEFSVSTELRPATSQGHFCGGDKSTNEMNSPFHISEQQKTLDDSTGYNWSNADCTDTNRSFKTVFNADHRQGMLANDVPDVGPNLPDHRKTNDHERTEWEGLSQPRAWKSNHDKSIRFYDDADHHAGQSYISVSIKNSNESKMQIDQRTERHLTRNKNVIGEWTESINPEKQRILNAKNGSDKRLSYQNRSTGNDRNEMNCAYNYGNRGFGKESNGQRNVGPQRRSSLQETGLSKDKSERKNLKERKIEYKKSMSMFHKEERFVKSQQERKQSCSGFRSMEMRISIEGNGRSSVSRKRANDVTEISPRKVKRTVVDDETRQENETKVEEITQRIRAKNATRYRATQLLNSPANVNTKSVHRI